MTVNEDFKNPSKKAEDQSTFRDVLDRFPTRRTIFIGLGGTGCQAVSKLKSLYTEVYHKAAARERDSNVSPIPDPFAFVGFDTNEGEAPANMTKGHEWYHIPVKNLREFYRHWGNHEFYKPWLCQDISGNSIADGARGYRNLGRLCVTSQMETIGQALDTAIEKVRQAPGAMRNNTPIVYIFCSLSGGTGSGAFLDFAFYMRHNFPEARLRGFLGLCSASVKTHKRPDDRQKLNIGSFMALKELDSFMALPESGVKQIVYPGDYSGSIEKPFDEAYLISVKNDSNANNLKSQAHLSSFIARLTFFLSAYAFDNRFLSHQAATPDYEGILSDHLDKLGQSSSDGAIFNYLVPSFAQIHFPIDKCVDTFVLRAAEDFIDFLLGGEALFGKNEADLFFQQHNLDKETVVNEMRMSGTETVRPSFYNDRIRDLFEDRYGSRAEILQFADNMKNNRKEQIRNNLVQNVARLFKPLERAIEEQMKGILADSKGLGSGAKSFLKRFKDKIKNEQDEIARNERHWQEQLDAQIKELDDYHNLLDDVTDNAGVIDRIADSWKVPTVIEMYPEILNQCDQFAYEWARTNLANNFYLKIQTILDFWIDRFEQRLDKTLPATLKLLRDHKQLLNDELARQSEGGESGVFNVNSTSVITQDWRENYYKRAQELKYNPPLLMGSFVNRGWHPLNLIKNDVPAEFDEARYIGGLLLDEINNMSFNDRNMTLADVLYSDMQVDHDNRVKKQKMAQKMRETIIEALKPQMPLTRHKSFAPGKIHDIVFAGGIGKQMAEALDENMREFQKEFNPSESWEQDRITFFASYLPISLAGCDVVVKEYQNQFERLENEYLRNKNKKAFEKEITFFSCFQRSWEWKDPTKLRKPVDEEKIEFAKALAIGDFLDVSATDIQTMKNFTKGPKEKRYALYQAGKSNFWLCPFFIPTITGVKHVDAGIIEGDCIRMGSNIRLAYDAYDQDRNAKEHVKHWVDWFEENSSYFLVNDDIVKKIDQAMDQFRKRRDKAQAIVDQRDLWDEFISILNEWRSDFS